VSEWVGFIRESVSSEKTKCVQKKYRFNGTMWGTLDALQVSRLGINLWDKYATICKNRSSFVTFSVSSSAAADKSN